MFRRVFLAVVLGGAFLAGPTWAQQPFPNNLVPSRRALERLGLERQWFGIIPLAETERLIRISFGPDLFFAQTDQGMLHAFDPESGRLLWSSNVGERVGFARGVATNSFGVYLTNANTMVALDKKTGRPVWKYKLDTIPTCSPTVDEKRLVVGLTNGMIVGFALSETNDKGVTKILTAPRIEWFWHGAGPITTKPFLTDHILAYTGHDANVHVVMTEEKTVLFRFKAGGEVGEALAGHDTRTLIIPSADNVVYALDIFTAATKWVFPSGAPVLQAPMVADQEIFLINSAGALSSLRPEDGQALWTTPTQDGRLAAVSQTKLYLRSYNRDLVAVDRQTGRTIIDPGESFQRAGLNLRDYDLDVVNRYNDRLYFATDSGMIVCLREATQRVPRLLRDPKAPPFGYVPPEGIKAPTIPVQPEAAASDLTVDPNQREASPAKPDAKPKDDEPAKDDKKPE